MLISFSWAFFLFSEGFLLPMACFSSPYGVTLKTASDVSHRVQQGNISELEKLFRTCGSTPSCHRGENRCRGEGRLPEAIKPFGAETWQELCFLGPSNPCLGEGNGNPLQYSCLENPVNRGAWRAAVHGVTQSWTRLK